VRLYVYDFNKPILFLRYDVRFYNCLQLAINIINGIKEYVDSPAYKLNLGAIRLCDMFIALKKWSELDEVEKETFRKLSHPDESLIPDGFLHDDPFI